MTHPAVLEYRATEAWTARAHLQGCRCTHPAAGECPVCKEGGAECPCHLAGPAEYAVTPPATVLGEGDYRRVQHCHVCGAKLRAGQAGPVTRERAGRWRHGPLEGSCAGVAKVPRGGRTLAWLLARSVSQLRVLDGGVGVEVGCGS